MRIVPRAPSFAYMPLKISKIPPSKVIFVHLISEDIVRLVSYINQVYTSSTLNLIFSLKVKLFTFFLCNLDLKSRWFHS